MNNVTCERAQIRIQILINLEPQHWFLLFKAWPWLAVSLFLTGYSCLKTSWRRGWYSGSGPSTFWDLSAIGLVSSSLSGRGGILNELIKMFRISQEGAPPPPQPLLEKSCARPCHFLKCSILKFSYERKCIYLVNNICSICFFLSLDGEDVRRYLLMVRGGFCFFPSSS